jgi:hypothetical protein
MKNEISQAAAAMGRAKSPAKTKAARANGQKGGSPRHWYLILSGEGETGTWEARQTTAYGLRRIVAGMTRDGFARGYQMAHECQDGLILIEEVGGKDSRSLSREDIEEAGVPAEAIP